ncbi:hypothetical protein A2886_02210 [candidate division WWE3 bacterium RIFCSPHIGHO2_01_FULL_42_13]|uniref:Uncharacterized protein n=1 Tax=candidate division WWE3 bacterium RIFCSPHIGHO2_01_FULL_42_13 TaxID=1802617 RepID=A0A1F4URP1_UNCKA|nr:MAG: hypothetical protein A2886_02210 [candidate division WWE3 bacterium RIFCSPHIGHO2_01_FULL_42_13]
MLNCSYFLSQFISQREFILGSFIVLILVWWFLFKTVRGRAEQILVGFVVGGAALNLLERVVFGCVRDYFNFFGLFRYNAWDIIITVGVLTILLRTAIKKFNAQ